MSDFTKQLEEAHEELKEEIATSLRGKLDELVENHISERFADLNEADEKDDSDDEKDDSDDSDDDSDDQKKDDDKKEDDE